MQIFIPTKERSHAQITWRNLPAELKENTHLVIHYDEHADYAGFPRICTDARGIGHVRQWLIDQAPSKMIMLDDDLRFAIRRPDDATRFVDADDHQIILAFAKIDSILDRWAHCSLATREGGNRVTDDYVQNTRMLRALAYRADVLKKENIRFDQIPVMEDFDVTLNLLRRGYPNIVLNWLVQDQAGSNKAGGCSTYRTMDVQSASAELLKARHPDFVEVVRKQTKTAWQGQERTDVRIKWKRAYESAGTAQVLG